MNELFSTTNVILVSCLALLAVMGIVVYRHNRRTMTGKYLSLIILASAFWILTNILANYSLRYGELVLLWSTRLAIVGPTFLPILLINFAATFPDDKSKLRIRTQYLYGFVTLLILILVPTQYNIRSVKIINLENYTSTFEPGWLYIFFTIFLVSGLVISSYILLRKLFKSKDIEKKQIILILTGIFLSFLSGVLVNVIFPILGLNDLINIGSASIVFFIIFTAFAILKYRLLDIKTIIAEIVVYLILIIIFIELFISSSAYEVVIRLILLVVMIYAGRLLIVSTQKEIRQKEELELLAHKLEQANTHLKDLDKMKDDFLSMASHELNTPLAAIEGYLSMMLEEGMGGGKDLPPQTREYLNRIYTSSERLAEIVKGLLNVSRIESGRIHLIYEQAQLDEIIKQSVAEIDPKVKEKNHTVCVELPSEPLPATYCDKTRITEVVLNFLGNAIKYTDSGGHIEIGAKQSDNHLMAWVKDNGRGIPKDKSDRVFQKFSQVDVLKDEVKGTGLGMYISQKFIELHKGKIWFESDGEGKGTTFFFKLPILKEKPYDPFEGEGAVLR